MSQSQVVVLSNVDLCLSKLELWVTGQCYCIAIIASAVQLEPHCWQVRFNSWNARFSLRCWFFMQGKRIVGFIIGGAARSEVRVAHQMAAKLGRDITLGATSVDTPASFLAHMRSLTGA